MWILININSRISVYVVSCVDIKKTSERSLQQSAHLVLTLVCNCCVDLILHILKCPLSLSGGDPRININ